MLAQMAQRYLQRDPFGSLYMLPLADATAGAAATGTEQLTGAATASGQLIRLSRAIRGYPGSSLSSMPATPPSSPRPRLRRRWNPRRRHLAGDRRRRRWRNADGLTASTRGELGNDVLGLLQQNYQGAAGGEYPVPGILVAFTAMAGGTANPSLANGLANLSSTPMDFICMPYTDTTSLNAMETFLNDASGRWSWSEMIYGGAFSAFRGTLGECTTFGLTRNDQHMSVVAFSGSPDPVWIWAAEITAACAASLRADPGLPLQYIGTTLQPPPISDQWTLGERNTLLYDGMSTTRVGADGTVIIERMATTYQKNLAGAADDSYLDVETMFGLMFVSRDLSNYLLTRYARKKLVSDTTQILAGSNCVNALMIKASVCSEYRALEAAGYVQNSTIFAQNIVVENAGNGLVKIMAPVDLTVDQLSLDRDLVTI